MDIVDALLGEHSALYAQFDHVEGVISQLSLDALKAQTEVAAALQSHSVLEDELLLWSRSSRPSSRSIWRRKSRSI